MIQNLQLVAYRPGRPSDPRSWAFELFSRVASAVSPQSAQSAFVLGPNVNEPGDSRWPIDKHGMRDMITLRHATTKDIAAAFASCPPDAECWCADATRRGAKDKLRDYSWGFKAETPCVTYSEFADLLRNGDTYRREISDSVLVWSLGLKAHASSPGQLAYAISRFVHASAAFPDTYYAFASIVDSDADSMGILYSSDIVVPYDPVLLKEEIAWWNAGGLRRTKVRGVYWGNYLGTQMAAAFREAGLLRIMQERAAEEHGELGAVSALELPQGACFVTLSEDVHHASAESAEFEQFKQRVHWVRELWMRFGFVVPQP